MWPWRKPMKSWGMRGKFSTRLLSEAIVSSCGSSSRKLWTDSSSYLYNINQTNQIKIIVNITYIFVLKKGKNRETLHSVYNKQTNTLKMQSNEDCSDNNNTIDDLLEVFKREIHSSQDLSTSSGQIKFNLDHKLIGDPSVSIDVKNQFEDFSNSFQAPFLSNISMGESDYGDSIEQIEIGIREPYNQQSQHSNHQEMKRLEFDKETRRMTTTKKVSESMDGRNNKNFLPSYKVLLKKMCPQLKDIASISFKENEKTSHQEFKELFQNRKVRKLLVNLYKKPGLLMRETQLTRAGCRYLQNFPWMKKAFVLKYEVW